MIIGKLSENIWVWFKIRKKGMFYFPDLKRHECCFNYFPSTVFSVTFSHFNIYLKHTTIWNQTLLKECLNSHQFQHYQQIKVITKLPNSEQSPLILSELTEHKKKDKDIWRWKSRSWLGTWVFILFALYKICILLALG